MTHLPAPGAGRRRRAQPRRDTVIRVKVTPGEAAAIKAAAERSGLSVGAWAGQALADAAEYRSVPVDTVLRDLLRELIRLSGLTRRAGTNLNQAVTRLNATGQPGPDLTPAADWVTRVAAHVDAASLAVSRKLTRRTR